jgi:putative hydrolase of the HAD superfamily
MTAPPSCRNEARTDVRAVIFDLGNVLIDVAFERCLAVWSRHSGHPESELRARFHVDTAYERFERGEIDAGAYFESLRRGLDLRMSDSQFTEGWNAVLCGERPGAADAVAMAAERGPVFLLTNTNAVHESVWSAAHRVLLAPFTKRFVSSRMGCRKPEAAIYRRAIAAIGLPPESVLFLDDSGQNVEGALAVGIRAHRYDPRDDLSAVLAGCLSGKE